MGVYRGIREVLQGCYRGVIWVLTGCYKNITISELLSDSDEFDFGEGRDYRRSFVRLAQVEMAAPEVCAMCVLCIEYWEQYVHN